MRVLTVYAHPNPTSFCRAVLDRFTQGLADAGHTYEVVDLYAIKFDPVFSRDDYSFFAHESVPPELYDENDLRQSIIAGAGGPMRRYAAKRWLRNKRLPEMLELVAKQRPKDVLAQQEKVAAADGLAFIAPIFWMNFPAILRGWVERVFTYGFVYTMTRDAWLQGDLGGRQPLLRHKKALIMTPTFFRESDYRESGCGAAIERLVDDFGFRYPGIENSSTSTSTQLAPSTTRLGATICSGRTGSVTSSSPASSRGRSTSSQVRRSVRSNRRELREVGDETVVVVCCFRRRRPWRGCVCPACRGQMRQLRLREDDRADA